MLNILFASVLSSILFVPQDYSTIDEALEATSADSDIVYVSSGYYKVGPLYPKSNTVILFGSNTTVEAWDWSHYDAESNDPFLSWEKSVFNLTDVENVSIIGVGQTTSFVMHRDHYPTLDKFEASDVNADSDTITITDHEWPTGMLIQYIGDNACGLTNGAYYWSIRIDSNTIQIGDRWTKEPIDLCPVGGTIYAHPKMNPKRSGVAILGGKNITISNVNFMDSAAYGVILSGSPGPGYKYPYSEGIDLIDLTVSGHPLHGVSVTDALDVKIVGLLAQENKKYGFEIEPNAPADRIEVSLSMSNFVNNGHAIGVSLHGLSDESIPAIVHFDDIYTVGGDIGITMFDDASNPGYCPASTLEVKRAFIVGAKRPFHYSMTCEPGVSIISDSFISDTQYQENPGLYDCNYRGCTPLTVSGTVSGIEYDNVFILDTYDRPVIRNYASCGGETDIFGNITASGGACGTDLCDESADLQIQCF